MKLMRGRSKDAHNLYTRLLAINRLAFSEAHYEVAYHALAAAMHSASDVGDRERLYDVQRLATEQRDWIDSNKPNHRLSSASARARGQHSLFGMLERQAEAASSVATISRRLAKPDE